jgi:membrane-bound lytic murein transglycosylase D
LACPQSNRKDVPCSTLWTYAGSCHERKAGGIAAAPALELRVRLDVEMTRTKAWLVSCSGPLAGSRYPLPDGATRIGRSQDNDIVIQGPQAAIVSQYHAEVSRGETGTIVRDMGSTNGTFLDGERIAETGLTPQNVLRLGSDGPEFTLLIEDAAPAELDATLVIPEGIVLPQVRPEPPAGSTQDALLSEAVTRARQARAHGIADQTMTLMREALNHAMRHSHRRFRAVILLLAVALVAVSAYGYRRIGRLKVEKASIDQRIRDIETSLQKMDQDPAQADRLISELTVYQSEAEALENSLLYRYGVRQKEDFILREIRAVMAEFGAEVYSVPPDFVERVIHYIRQYQGPDRPNMERALNQAAPQLALMQRILREEKLPPDFAFVPLVETAMSPGQSSAGAAGPWQFTSATARAYGLRVDGRVDERLDLHKSTLAGSKYLRELILDFGTGSSVMLALAAYNLGPTRVKQAVMKVEDPIKQRSFWYLYRIRALPAETREYVPKVFAAIIIGRDPDKFGF